MDKIKRVKFIGCEVFVRSASKAIAESELSITPIFFEKNKHEKAELVREAVQSEIDAAEEAEGEGYDAIAVGYGLCGNGLDGITARSIPLIIPRAHDCCTLFLGSRAKFVEHFGDNPSAQWSSAGYMERGEGYLRETETGKALGLGMSKEDMVAQYGEDNAEYLMSMLKVEEVKEYLYISANDPMDNIFINDISEKAKAEGKPFKLIEGSTRLITKLLSGEWDEEFLIVRPGHRVKAVYDMEKVFIEEEM
jgi:hypothetical protein